MTPREAAAVLGVRAATAPLPVRSGLLKPVSRTPGGHHRYLRGDVLALRDAPGLREDVPGADGAHTLRDR